MLLAAMAWPMQGTAIRDITQAEAVAAELFHLPQPVKMNIHDGQT